MGCRVKNKLTFFKIPYDNFEQTLFVNQKSKNSITVSFGPRTMRQALPPSAIIVSNTFGVDLTKTTELWMVGLPLFLGTKTCLITNGMLHVPFVLAWHHSWHQHSHLNYQLPIFYDYLYNWVKLRPTQQVATKQASDRIVQQLKRQVDDDLRVLETSEALVDGAFTLPESDKETAVCRFCHNNKHVTFSPIQKSSADEGSVIIYTCDNKENHPSKAGYSWGDR